AFDVHGVPNRRGGHLQVRELDLGARGLGRNLRPSGRQTFVRGARQPPDQRRRYFKPCMCMLAICAACVPGLSLLTCSRILRDSCGSFTWYKLARSICARALLTVRVGCVMRSLYSSIACGSRFVSWYREASASFARDAMSWLRKSAACFSSLSAPALSPNSTSVSPRKYCATWAECVWRYLSITARNRGWAALARSSLDAK